MATLGVRFDGMTMFPGGQPYTRDSDVDELFQHPVINEMSLLEDYNGSALGLPDFCPATPGIVTPIAREQLVDPLNFVSDRHYHHYPDDQHQHRERAYSQPGHPRQYQWRQSQEYHQQEQQQQQQQQQQLFRPYYQNEQQYLCLPGHIEAQEHNSDPRPGLEIPNATPETTLTWATTPTTQSPIPSSPFGHFQNDHQANKDPYSPAEHSFCLSSQVELGTNPTQSTRNFIEKSPSPYLTAATKRKGSQTTLQGSIKPSRTKTPRKRSKEWIRYIESTSRQLEDRYYNLKAERERLLEETLQLKSDLIAHAQCKDARLDAWISHEAHKFVGAAGSPCADAQPSPTEGVEVPSNIG
ncbi:hypothetical protein E4U17_005841 [Claviceps sp. LM77 group G4]|nr:hypothetical protein E4U17_005841 [Claviceps sp. LM77 group G4]